MSSVVSLLIFDTWLIFDTRGLGTVGVRLKQWPLSWISSCLCLELCAMKHLPPPAGGGVTLRGSDGQLHPRAPPKPLRISAVFPNAVIPPPRQRDEDPSSFYDELVVQVTVSSLIFIILFVYPNKKGTSCK